MRQYFFDETIMRIRRGTRTQWLDRNPVLASGEPALELDTMRLKVGNGLAVWSDLPYISKGDPGPGEIPVGGQYYMVSVDETGDDDIDFPPAERPESLWPGTEWNLLYQGTH